MGSVVERLCINTRSACRPWDWQGQIAWKRKMPVLSAALPVSESVIRAEWSPETVSQKSVVLHLGLLQLNNSQSAPPTTDLAAWHTKEFTHVAIKLFSFLLGCPCCGLSICSGLKQTDGVNLEHFAKVQEAYDTCMAWLAFRKNGRLSDWFSDWLTDWLTDWLAYYGSSRSSSAVYFWLYQLTKLRHAEFAGLVQGSQPKSLAEGSPAPPLDVTVLAGRSAQFAAQDQDADDGASRDIIFGCNLTWLSITLLGSQRLIWFWLMNI